MEARIRHDWRTIARILISAIATTFVFALGVRMVLYGPPQALVSLMRPAAHTGTAAAPVTPAFSYAFDSNGTLEEAGSPDESSSPYWWLDSGGTLILKDGVGATVAGSLPAIDRWRIRYAVSNSRDTGNGYYPQNLFRLLTRSTWQDVRVEARFRILADNTIDSPNRNESNGLLLMTRYTDADDLYYAGIRVDGTAVIKKKYGGKYYTMAQQQVFPGEYHTGGESLLPHDEWIGLRAETSEIRGGTRVRLYMRRGEDAPWKLLLSATDDGETFGNTPPLHEAGRVGIRTDFMDVQFDDFKAQTI